MSEDMLKGAKQIGEAIGETEWSAFKLLQRGYLSPVAYKRAGRWRASKAALLKFWAERPAEAA